MNVDEALKTRVSIRAFKPDRVEQALVREIIDLARYAPSGGNLQPWKVIAVAGKERDEVVRIAKQNVPGDEGERFVYPANLWEPYRTRRYKVGEDMYALLAIPREDKPARWAHVARNFDFFDAPVGLFFVIDTRMGYGQWAALGMFMQSLALAATARGLGSCCQEFWARQRAPLHAHFKLDDNEMIYCGMALGYPDMDKPVNTLRSERAAVEEIASFRGF